MWIVSYDPQSARVSQPASSLPGCENPLKDMGVCTYVCVCVCVSVLSHHQCSHHMHSEQCVDMQHILHVDRYTILYLCDVYCTMHVCVRGATKMGRRHSWRLNPPLGVLTPISKAHQESINTSGRGQRLRQRTLLHVHARKHTFWAHAAHTHGTVWGDIHQITHSTVCHCVYASVFETCPSVPRSLMVWGWGTDWGSAGGSGQGHPRLSSVCVSVCVWSGVWPPLPGLRGRQKWIRLMVLIHTTNSLFLQNPQRINTSTEIMKEGTEMSISHFIFTPSLCVCLPGVRTAAGDMKTIHHCIFTVRLLTERRMGRYSGHTLQG